MTSPSAVPFGAPATPRRSSSDNPGLARKSERVRARHALAEDFLARYCVREAGTMIPTQDLYAAYCAAYPNGERESRTFFVARVEDVWGCPRRSVLVDLPEGRLRRRVFVGIRLR
jgi:hypothetical protein